MDLKNYLSAMWETKEKPITYLIYSERMSVKCTHNGRMNHAIAVRMYEYQQNLYAKLLHCS